MPKVILFHLSFWFEQVDETCEISDVRKREENACSVAITGGVQGGTQYRKTAQISAQNRKPSILFSQNRELS